MNTTLEKNSYPFQSQYYGDYWLSLTQDSQSESYESVDFIEKKSVENLDGPEDKFGFNKTLWTPEESSRANGKKLKWLLVSTSLKSHVSWVKILKWFFDILCTSKSIQQILFVNYQKN